MSDSLRELVSSYDAAAPLKRAWTIPAGWYFDQRIAELERSNVFGGAWQAVGRAQQVAQPGQFITTEIAGEPIVIVRGADGVLRAFYNVCRHHAAAVMTEEAGCAQLLRCPYHGWTYGLDGALKGAPEFTGVQNVNPGQNGLLPVRVEVWEKFVFVALEQNAAPLKEFVGEFAGRVAPLNSGRLKFVERHRYELNCNWKIYVDNYLDGGYHVPHLHKGLNSVLEYRDYTIENGERFCVQASPMRSSSEVKSSVTATRAGDMAYYLWLYPNFMLNWYEGAMDTNLVLPLGTDRTLVIFDFYFAENWPLERARQSIEVSARIQAEDVAICEAVQRGLRSRAYNAGRLSVRREAGEHLFHRLLAADLKRGIERGAAV